MTAKIFLTTLTTFVFSLLGVYAYIRFARRYHIMDIPNVRSSHSQPVPRGGGIGLLLGIGVSAALASILGVELPSWPIWLGLVLVAGVGFWDDLRGELQVPIRLLAQLCAALLVVSFSGRLTSLPLPPPADLSLNGLGYLISVIWILAVLNFFNFMDGIDGIAGSQALITGIALAFAVGMEGAWLGATIAGSSLGFLLLNWQPAKIFLGDIGSYSLGFMLAAAPLQYGSERASRLTMLVGLSLWMFLADASLTFIHRLFSKGRVWEAHRNHFYQRLVKSGLSHKQVTLLVAACAVTTSAMGVSAYKADREWLWWIAFLVAVLVFVLEVVLTRYRERINSSNLTHEE
ncbi:MAG: glycosyltransferase family 4 protein [Cyanobacteriota bacterium]